MGSASVRMHYMYVCVCVSLEVYECVPLLCWLVGNSILNFT